MKPSVRSLLLAIMALAIFAGCAETPAATSVPAPTGTSVQATATSTLIPAPTPTGAPTATPTPPTAAGPTSTATVIPATPAPTLTILTPTPTSAPTATPTPPPTPSPTATTTPGSGTAVLLTIQNFRLEDRTVRVGDTVVWTNRDAAPHTTTSGTSSDPNGIWNSGTLQSGGSFTFTFNQTGIFPYFCAIHPSMTGVITVVESSNTITPETTPTSPASGVDGSMGGDTYDY